MRSRCQGKRRSYASYAVTSDLQRYLYAGAFRIPLEKRRN